MTLSLTNVSTQNTQIYQVATSNPTTSYTAVQASHVSTGTTNNALALNPSGGNVGVGTTSPQTTLHVNSSGASTSSGIISNRYYLNGPGDNMDTASTTDNVWGPWYGMGYSPLNNPCVAGYGGVELRTGNGTCILASNGNFGIGTTNPTSKLDVYAATATDGIRFYNTVNGSTGSISLSVATVAGSFIINGTANAGLILADQDLFLNRDSSLNCAMVVKGGTGNVGIGTPNPSAKLQVNGSLAKSSGTFDIGHPLHPDTNKRLVHSFIEGPRCDLIYRGKTTLVNGTAVVNIDKECTHSPECAMDEGTFEALCDNPQIFLQNNQSFDRIRGVIAGATLTITCETPAAVEIEWMVIAERADSFIKQWDRTNPDGYLVTQYSGDASVPTPLSNGAEAAPSE